MFAKILVPLDGSDVSEKALDYAKELARAYSAEIILVRAVVVNPAVWVAEDLIRDPLEKAVPPAEDELNALSQQLQAAGFKVRTHVAMGDPAEVILDFADEDKVDLIVMTSHGRSGVKRWLVGSVAERVMRHAHCPTFTVNQGVLSAHDQDGTVAVVDDVVAHTP